MTDALNTWTARAIRTMIVVGIAVLVVGLLLDHEVMMWVGLGAVIASPFAGLLVSLAILIRERDLWWAAVAGALVALLVGRLLLTLV